MLVYFFLRKFMPKENFALSNIYEDQVKDLKNHLNQEMIATINTVDGSALGDNLITSHQVDYMSSALIPAEAVENDQERPCHL